MLILFVYYFILFQSSHCPPPDPPPRVPYPIFPPPCLQENAPTTGDPPSLGSQVFRGLGLSSLTKTRPDSYLLYMCQGPWASSCMLPDLWLSAWEISGIQVSWDCWSSYGVSLLNFFQPFPNPTTGIPDFSPLVVCKYLHLSQSAASRTSEGEPS